MKQLFQANSVILTGQKKDVLFSLKQAALTHEYVTDWLHSAKHPATKPTHLKRIK